MRTTRLLALLAAFAAGATASQATAQLPSPAGLTTLVYWRDVTPAPNPTNHFKFIINNTNTTLGTFPNVCANISALAMYPMGRQFFVEDVLDPTRFGLIPDTLARKKQIRFVPERNSMITTVLTNFNNGPEYMDRPDPRWSSDMQDTFFTFTAYVPPKPTPWPGIPAFRKVYRFSGSKSIFWSPTFTPFVPLDPRLTLAASITVDSTVNDWNSTGQRLVFSTPGPAGVVTRTVPFQGTMLTSTIVNDPVVSGFTLLNPVCSPTNTDVVYSVVVTAGGARGIAAFNTQSQTLGFIILEGGVGLNAISNFTTPQVSPDGRTLAFTMMRVLQSPTGTTPVVSLVRIPVTGGVFSPLWSIAARTNNYEVTGWTLSP